MRLAILLIVAACDPVWNASVRLRDPANRPIEGATLAVACREDAQGFSRGAHRTDTTGAATVGSMGSTFPPGCDVYVAKPGYQTQRIRYRDLCPQGPDDCERVFDFDLMLEPE
jgi:hypothetical protein